MYNFNLFIIIFAFFLQALAFADRFHGGIMEASVSMATHLYANMCTKSKCFRKAICKRQITEVTSLAVGGRGNKDTIFNQLLVE